MYSTKDIPQADNLQKVITVIDAVYSGCSTQSQIAKVLEYTERQARYYRHAAKILGFITYDNNNAVITNAGKEFAETEEEDIRYILIRISILNNSFLDNIVHFVQNKQNGFIWEDVRDYILSITDHSAHSTIPRRTKTILSWLEELNFIIESGDVYIYNEDVEVDLDPKTKEESIYPVNYSREIDIKEDRFTVFELLRKIKAQKVIMDPEFQRNLVWKPQQMSTFIESIILNVPLPPFYFKKDLDGRFIIVDGLQRTSTLQRFINNEFSLQGLNALPNLNTLFFRQLDEELRTRIEDKNLLIYLIQPSVPMVVVYDIFNRINTGGTKLERQEIRNCIFIGPSTQLLQRLSRRLEFKQAIDSGIPDTRMKDREAILRCIAFTILDFESEYKNSMDDFLEKAMKAMNRMSPLEIDTIENNFVRVMTLTYQIFKEKNFRIPTDYSRGRINIAIMETIFFFYTKVQSGVLLDKNRMHRNYNKLLNNKEFQDSVRYATGSTSKVKTRFRIATEILNE